MKVNPDKLFILLSFFYKNILYFRSSNFKDGFSGSKSILAFNLKQKITIEGKNEFSQMQDFVKNHINKNKIFAIIKYEAENKFAIFEEKDFLDSKNSTIFNNKNKIILMIFKNTIDYNNITKFADLTKCKNKILIKTLTLISKLTPLSLLKIGFIKKTSQIKSNFSDNDYLSKVNFIINHLKNGDFLQLNLTRKYFTNCIKFNTAGCFLKLCERSNVFYSSFIKLKNEYILCLSPERFLKKTHNTITTTPIKGSVKNLSDYNQIKNELMSQKNFGENLMITDLMRNDLSKISKVSTVKTEPFIIDTYKNISHLSSTVSGELKDSSDIAQIFASTTPIGSMTGAPKNIVLENISKYEFLPRGVYSGSIGYFYQNKNNDIDFDFCVVIRTILINKNKLQIQAGGGITHLSKPKDELEELNLKLKFLIDFVS